MFCNRCLTMLVCVSLFLFQNSILHGQQTKRRTSIGRVPDYHLGPGDLLAVIVHGVIGRFGKAPVHFPKPADDSFPAMGFPIRVHDDGLLHLTQIEPVSVVGMTVVQAKQAISQAYLDEKILTKPNLVILTLLRKRTIRVTVVHDNPNAMQKVEKVALTADQATLLGALATVDSYDPKASVRVMKPSTRMTASETLVDGSVVYLRSAPPQYYYTGGLVAGGQHLLPAQRPMTAVQAIASAGGYRQGGIIPAHQLTIVRGSSPPQRVPLRNVLNNSMNYIVQPGDHLLVR